MPTPLTPAGLAAHLAALPLSDDDRARLTQALASPLCFTKGLRASYLTPLHAWMDSHPDALPAYSALRATLPERAPFDFVPLAELLLLLTRAYTLRWPDAPLAEGCNRAAEAYIASMSNHAMLSAMMATCNHDLFEYLDLVSRSWHLWYNFGSRTSHRLAPDAVTLRYADAFTDASALWQPGLNRGLLRLFGRDGAVHFTPHDASGFSIEVALSCAPRAPSPPS